MTVELRNGIWPAFREGRLLMACAGLFTLIDLFGPQAIAPLLAERLRAGPAEMSSVLNAATIGMAISGFLAACFGDSFDRKRLIVTCLFALAGMTLLLAISGTLLSFALLRVAQGLFMGTAFAVSVAFIAEQWGPVGAASGVMAAYVTGNIVGQMLGRMIAGAVAQMIGWPCVFLAFAAINLMGALVLWSKLPGGRPQRSPDLSATTIAGRLIAQLSDPRLQGAFAIGFLILAIFATEFTYVNFRLAGPPFNVSPRALGLLYAVFCVAAVTTPFAGRIVRQLGHRGALAFGAAFTIFGALLTLSGSLWHVVCGITIIASGLFFSQAVATAYTGFAADRFKATASGLYMVGYYTGGIFGTAILGVVFEHRGWGGLTLTIIALLTLMALIALMRWQKAPRTTAEAMFSRPFVGAKLLD
jgi:predicted MFS family arabinose efflux permease